MQEAVIINIPLSDCDLGSATRPTRMPGTWWTLPTISTGDRSIELTSTIGRN